MLDKLVRKVLGAVAGVIVCIAIWTIQDRLTGGGDNTAKSIPAEVWGGGGGVVTIKAEASEPAIISASFENHLAIDDPKHEYFESWQEIPAGEHTFTINVPNNVGGSVEMRMVKPSVGAKMKITILVDDRVVSESFERLEEPLEPGYGFFTGIDLEDYARGKLAEEGFFD